MKTIGIVPGENRWEELVATLEAGEVVSLVEAGVPIGKASPRGEKAKIKSREEAWESLRRLREQLPPRGNGPSAVDLIREMRAE